MVSLIKQVHAVIHTAAQPSHPKSVEIPIEDFQINAFGTSRYSKSTQRMKHNKNAIFVYCSTNKVYGDVPNFFSYKQVHKRLEPVSPSLSDGFDENLKTDRCMHTPFGVSKLTADTYTQRICIALWVENWCFPNGMHYLVAQQKPLKSRNWEPYFIKKALSGEKLTVYGYGGYQVRDVVIAADLAELFLEFINNPHPGEVYNVGGSRQNSISLLESFDLIESTAKK